MNLTELLATPVIDLETARRLGVVSAFGISENLRRIVQVAVIDEDNYSRELRYAFADLKWGQDFVLTTAGVASQTATVIPFRGQIVDADGVGHGYLKEVECGPKGRIIALITTEDERIAPTRLAAVGDVVLLKGKRRYARRTDEQKAADAAEHAEIDVERAFNLPKSEGLRRVAGDYSFLLGRKIKSDLIGRGEVVLPQGSVITAEHIELAREKGVLLPLTELSR